MESEDDLPLGIPKSQGLKSFTQKYKDFSQINNTKDSDELPVNAGKKIYKSKFKSCMSQIMDEKQNIGNETIEKKAGKQYHH